MERSARSAAKPETRHSRVSPRVAFFRHYSGTGAPREQVVSRISESSCSKDSWLRSAGKSQKPGEGSAIYRCPQTVDLALSTSTP